MSTTLTVRVDEELRQALERRAGDLGITVSELVREILADGLADRPMSERVGHLKGSVDLPVLDDEWRRQIKDRNWRS